MACDLESISQKNESRSGVIPETSETKSSALWCISEDLKQGHLYQHISTGCIYLGLLDFISTYNQILKRYRWLGRNCSCLCPWIVGLVGESMGIFTFHLVKGWWNQGFTHLQRCVIRNGLNSCWRKWSNDLFQTSSFCLMFFGQTKSNCHMIWVDMLEDTDAPVLSFFYSSF